MKRYRTREVLLSASYKKEVQKTCKALSKRNLPTESAAKRSTCFKRFSSVELGCAYYRQELESKKREFDSKRFYG